jgi:hypothetical protein
MVVSGFSRTKSSAIVWRYPGESDVSHCATTVVLPACYHPAWMLQEISSVVSGFSRTHDICRARPSGRAEIVMHRVNIRSVGHGLQAVP